MTSVDDFDGLATIPLAPLLELWHPLFDNIWGCGPVTHEMVRSVTGRQSTPSVLMGESALYHAERIAYLVDAGWRDSFEDSEPITVDVGMAGYTPAVIVIDGNHRLAAAVLRGETELIVEIAGSWDKALAFFYHGVHLDDWDESMSFSH